MDEKKELTEERKDIILEDFKEWSGGKSPWESCWEHEVIVYIDNCLYGEDNKDSIIISKWLFELCHDEEE